MSIFNKSTHGRRQAPLPGTEAAGDVGGLRLVVPGAALLIILGLFGYALSTGSAGDRSPIKAASIIAQNKPAASPQTPWAPSQLPARNQNGLTNAATTGDFAVQAGWVRNLSARFTAAGGSLTPLAGNGFIAIPSTYLPQFIVAASTGKGPAGTAIALSTAAPRSTAKGQVSPSNQAALESLTIDFPANSSKLPSRSKPLLMRIAAMIKQLPAGTVVELNGYTASTGNSSGDTKLSQQRADSVYWALVHAGVSPAMLSPKGFGSRPLQASADSATEGRSSTMTRRANPSDRLVEFHVVQ